MKQKIIFSALLAFLGCKPKTTGTESPTLSLLSQTGTDVIQKQELASPIAPDVLYSAKSRKFQCDGLQNYWNDVSQNPLTEDPSLEIQAAKIENTPKPSLTVKTTEKISDILVKIEDGFGNFYFLRGESSPVPLFFEAKGKFLISAVFFSGNRKSPSFGPIAFVDVLPSLHLPMSFAQRSFQEGDSLDS